jgi:hypothetical protein
MVPVTSLPIDYMPAGLWMKVDGVSEVLQKMDARYEGLSLHHVVSTFAKSTFDT